MICWHETNAIVTIVWQKCTPSISLEFWPTFDCSLPLCESHDFFCTGKQNKCESEQKKRKKGRSIGDRLLMARKIVQAMRRWSRSQLKPEKNMYTLWAVTPCCPRTGHGTDPWSPASASPLAVTGRGIQCDSVQDRKIAVCMGSVGSSGESRSVLAGVLSDRHLCPAGWDDQVVAAINTIQTRAVTSTDERRASSADRCLDPAQQKFNFKTCVEWTGI